MPITIASRKSKARELQKWIADKISLLIDLPWGKDEQIASREMGQGGPDIRLVGEARTLFPWSVEAKRQESWSIHNWIQQAQDNQMPGTDWLLIAKSNRKDAVVILDADVFFDLLRLISGRVKGR
ncbi:MAG: hypothetical protein KKE05_07055 [Nanoarchaeota archaeon]|nr:hypothetical protein [Nanoarchaeota archaeon]